MDCRPSTLHQQGKYLRLLNGPLYLHELAANLVCVLCSDGRVVYSGLIRGFSLKTHACYLETKQMRAARLHQNSKLKN